MYLLEALKEELSESTIGKDLVKLNESKSRQYLEWVHQLLEEEIVDWNTVKSALISLSYLALFSGERAKNALMGMRDTPQATGYKAYIEYLGERARKGILQWVESGGRKGLSALQAHYNELFRQIYENSEGIAALMAVPIFEGRDSIITFRYDVENTGEGRGRIFLIGPDKEEDVTDVAWAVCRRGVPEKRKEIGTGEVPEFERPGRRTSRSDIQYLDVPFGLNPPMSRQAAGMFQWVDPRFEGRAIPFHLFLEKNDYNKEEHFQAITYLKLRAKALWHRFIKRAINVACMDTEWVKELLKTHPEIMARSTGGSQALGKLMEIISGLNTAASAVRDEKIAYKPEFMVPTIFTLVANSPHRISSVSNLPDIVDMPAGFTRSEMRDTADRIKQNAEGAMEQRYPDAHLALALSQLYDWAVKKLELSPSFMIDPQRAPAPPGGEPEFAPAAAPATTARPARPTISVTPGAEPRPSIFGAPPAPPEAPARPRVRRLGPTGGGETPPAVEPPRRPRIRRLGPTEPPPEA